MSTADLITMLAIALRDLHAEAAIIREFPDRGLRPHPDTLAAAAAALRACHTAIVCDCECGVQS